MKMEVTKNSYCSLGLCQVFCRSPNACRICCLITGLGDKLNLNIFHANMFK